MVEWTNSQTAAAEVVVEAHVGSPWVKGSSIACAAA